MKDRAGFVLIEMIVVFGMLAVLTVMTVTNIFGSKRTATLSGAIDTVIADIKSQQIKAMSGAQINGTSPLGYGIYFDSSGYTLFRGLTYSALDITNARVTLDTRLQIVNILFPSSSLVFASRSGEMVGYDSNANSFAIRNVDSGEIKTIQINRYGVISSIN